MQDHEMEKQLHYLGFIYRKYRNWLQGDTSNEEYYMHTLYKIVQLIEEAIINMQEKERIYLVDMYFIGNGELTHTNNAWRYIEKDVKIKVMSSFFRCLKG